ncbi:hypothetical protein ACEU6E_06245 [Halorutilales archaeon Cl-col2-1]
MDMTRFIRLFSVLIILAGIGVSGSPFELISAEADNGVSLGNQGSVSVKQVSLSSKVFKLEPGMYGSETYYLHTPSATVEIREITGSPILVYKMEIPELGYTGTSLRFMEEKRDSLKLSLRRNGFSPDEIQNNSYNGTVSVLVRNGNSTRSLYSDNVSIEVNE